MHPAVWPQQTWAKNWGGGPGSPSNKVAWAKAYLHTKWHLSSSSCFTTMDMGRKLGERLCPHVTQCRLRPGLPSGILIHPAIWPQQLWSKNWGALPLWGGGVGSPSNTMWPRPRPTTIPSFILIHPTVWPQYTNVTDRRGRQTVQLVS